MAAGASALMSSLPESAAWKAAISAAAISVADLSFAEPAGPNSDVAGLPGLPVLLAGLDSGPADTAARPSGDGAPRSSARWLLLPLLGAPLLRRSAWVRRSLSCWGAALAAPPRPSGAVPGLLSRGPEGTASAAAGPARQTMGWWRWRLVGAAAGNSPSSASELPSPSSPSLPHLPFRFASPPAGGDDLLSAAAGLAAAAARSLINRAASASRLLGLTKSRSFSPRRGTGGVPVPEAGDLSSPSRPRATGLLGEGRGAEGPGGLRSAAAEDARGSDSPRSCCLSRLLPRSRSRSVSRSRSRSRSRPLLRSLLGAAGPGNPAAEDGHGGRSPRSRSLSRLAPLS